MPGARPQTRLSATSAWQAQQHLTELTAALDSAPEHLSIPGHIRTATDTALRCISISTPSESAPAVAGHSHTQSAAASVYTLQPVGLRAAAQHLHAALAMVPAHMGHMAHSIANAFLLLSTHEGRAAAERLNASIDELALPATWHLPLTNYLQLVDCFGWEELLLDSLTMMGATEAGAAVVLADQQVSSMAVSLGNAPPGKHYTASLSLLKQMVEVDHTLSASLLTLLWPPAAPPSPSSAIAQAAPAQYNDISGVWPVTVVLLDAWYECASNGHGLTSQSGPQPVTLCLSLCACMHQGLHELSVQVPSAEAVVVAAMRKAALLLEQLLQLIPEQGDAVGCASCKMNLAQLQQWVALLLNVTLPPGKSHKPVAQDYPSAEILRLRCRLTMLSPTLHAYLSALHSPSPSQAEAPASQAHPCGFTQAGLIMHMSGCSEPTGAEGGDQGDVFLKALSQHGFAAAALQAQGVPLPGIWQTALKPVMSLQSQHGLPEALIRALQVMADNPTCNILSATMLTPTTNGAPPTARPGTAIPAVSAHAAATAAATAAVTPAWLQLQRNSRLSASQRWQQVVAGWVLVGLTPGLPCMWRAVSDAQVVAAVGAGSYSPLRTSLALIDLAACMQQCCLVVDAKRGMGASKAASGSRLLLPLHPLLPDLLLSMAASAMQQVAQPEQQLAVQCVVQEDPLLYRLVRHLSTHETTTTGVSATMVCISNRLSGATATQQTGPVVLGAHAMSKVVAGATSDVLPFAVLTPAQLLRRAVTDCVQHPGQLPFWLQLLSGPLRPTTTNYQPSLSTQPSAVGHDLTMHQTDSLHCNLVEAVRIYVLENSASSGESGGGGGLPDGQLKALGGLLLGCMAPHASTQGHGQAGALLDMHTLVDGLLMPLLEWCSQPAHIGQARTILIIISHVLSAPNTSSSSTQHHLNTQTAPTPRFLTFATLLRHTESASCHIQQSVVGLLLGVCALLGQLQTTTEQNGSLHAGSIELGTEILEGCVAALSMVVSDPGFNGRHAISLAQALMSSDVVSGGGAGVTPLGLLAGLLPVLQACIFAASRPPAGETTDNGNEELEDTSRALSSRLLRLLLPASSRPSQTQAPATAAEAVQQQLSALLWFAASADQHASLLVSAVKDWAQGELEDRLEDLAGGGGSPKSGIAAHQDAIAFLDWAQGRLMCAAAAAASGTSGIARTVASGMQRQLVRFKPAQLMPALEVVLACSLPVMSAAQAERGMVGCVSCVVGFLTASGQGTVQAWVDQVLDQYQSCSTAGDVNGAALARTVRNVLAHGCGGDGVKAQRVGVMECVAHTLHVMCNVVRYWAGVPQGGRQAVHRCLQHLIATTRVCTSGSAISTSSSASASASSWAGPAHQIRTGTVSVLAWCTAVLALPDLVGCLPHVLRVGGGTELLQVAVLDVLKQALLPHLRHSQELSLTQQPLDVDVPPGDALVKDSQDKTGVAYIALDLVGVGAQLPYKRVVKCVGVMLAQGGWEWGQEVASLGAGWLAAVRLAAMQVVEQHVENCLGEGVDVDEALGESLDALLSVV